MKKKLQIFVSSTYNDLIEERQAAVEAILKAGHIPAGMELFTAGDISQMETIKRWIDSSDIYMLILGGRYGSIEPTTKLSYTELEYDYAVSINKPLFAVVIKENAIDEKVKKYGREMIETEKFLELQSFRAKVLSKTSSFFSDSRDIKLAVHESVNDFLTQYNFKGWVSGEYAKTEEDLEKLTKMHDYITKLEEEVEELKRQISYDTSHLSQGDDVIDFDWSINTYHVNEPVKITWNDLFLEIAKTVINGQSNTMDKYIKMKIADFIGDKIGLKNRNAILSDSSFASNYEKIKAQFIALDLFNLQIHNYGENNMTRQFWELTSKGKHLFTNLSAIKRNNFKEK